jgi:hypothetical protein
MDPRRDNFMQQRPWYPTQITIIPGMQPMYQTMQQPTIATVTFYPMTMTQQMAGMQQISQEMFPQPILPRPPASVHQLPNMQQIPNITFPTNERIPQISLPPPGVPEIEIPEERESAKKNDRKIHKTENGVYKCTKCERTYLSYPALYTHIKIKHPPPKINGSSAAKTSTRGRPKKNVII